MTVLVLWPAGALADVFSAPCRLFNISPALAMAMAKVESDWNPWCLNVDGRDVHPRTLAEAARVARRAMREGRSVDVGLMQVNSYWLRKWRISPERALRPETNVALGLAVLSYEMKRHGNTWKAVGYYHSPSQTRQKRYVTKVARAHAAIEKALAARGSGTGTGPDRAAPGPGKPSLHPQEAAR